MNDLPTRLRAYNPHDATARALMDEAAVRIESQASLIDMYRQFLVRWRETSRQQQAEIERLQAARDAREDA